MKTKLALKTHLGIIVCLCSTVSALSAADQSPQAIIADSLGQQLFVTEHTAQAVAVLNAETGAVLRRINLPTAPGGLALSPNDATLYVTGETPEGVLLYIDAASGNVLASVPLGHNPGAIVVSADGALLYACNRFSNTVTVIDAAARAAIAHIPVLREPTAAALTPDGARLYVANLLPVGASDGDYAAASVSVIDTATRSLLAETALPNGSTGVRGVCSSPDGNHVYVAHILARYHLPTTQLERGWMNTNALSILDARTGAYINTVLLDDVDLGAANPWTPACTPDGSRICVTHAGSHELSVIDRIAMHERLEQADEAAAKQIPNNLAFLVGLRQRVKLPGKGPRGLWLNNDVAYVAQYYSDSIVILPLDPARIREMRDFSIGTGAPISPERQGEIFFNDAALCFQQWQSCASCHPDARVDGLNWDLLNDGIGNPKNTRSMLLSHQTPPVMGLGVRADAEMAVRAGIKFIKYSSASSNNQS